MPLFAAFTGGFGNIIRLPFVEVIYTVTTSANNVTEGNNLTITVATQGVPDGTNLYWTISNPPGGSDVQTDDFDSFTGSFAINGNTGSFTISPVNEGIVEGPALFIVQIRTGSILGDVVAVTETLTLNDPPPTYAISPAAASVNEGSSLTFNVTTTNVSSGVTLYWTLSRPEDFSVSSGSFTISNNAGSFSVTPNADATTEGAETFTASVRTGSTSGDIVATSSSVTINDTSLTPATTKLTFDTPGVWITGLSAGTYTLKLWGGGGGGSSAGSNTGGYGGAGGFIRRTITLASSENAYVYVADGGKTAIGNADNSSAVRGRGGYGIGVGGDGAPFLLPSQSSSAQWSGGGGGGSSGIRSDSITLTAPGGGGAGGDGGGSNAPTGGGNPGGGLGAGGSAGGGGEVGGSGIEPKYLPGGGGGSNLPNQNQGHGGLGGSWAYDPSESYTFRDFGETGGAGLANRTNPGGIDDPDYGNDAGKGGSWTDSMGGFAVDGSPGRVVIDGYIGVAGATLLEYSLTPASTTINLNEELIFSVAGPTALSSEDFYWNVVAAQADFTQITGSVTLSGAGNYASGSGSFSVTPTAVYGEGLCWAYLRKDSTSGPMLTLPVYFQVIDPNAGGGGGGAGGTCYSTDIINVQATHGYAGQYGPAFSSIYIKFNSSQAAQDFANAVDSSAGFTATGSFQILDGDYNEIDSGYGQWQWPGSSWTIGANGDEVLFEGGDGNDLVIDSVSGPRQFIGDPGPWEICEYVSGGGSITAQDVNWASFGTNVSSPPDTAFIEFTSESSRDSFISSIQASLPAVLTVTGRLFDAANDVIITAEFTWTVETATAQSGPPGYFYISLEGTGPGNNYTSLGPPPSGPVESGGPAPIITLGGGGGGGGAGDLIYAINASGSDVYIEWMTNASRDTFAPTLEGWNVTWDAQNYNCGVNGNTDFSAGTSAFGTIVNSGGDESNWDGSNWIGQPPYTTFTVTMGATSGCGNGSNQLGQGTIARN